MIHPSIEKIREGIAPLRDQLLNHPAYAEIHDLQDLQMFMRIHVYAVWDFMSLLKSLQNDLTCTEVPWFPVGDANTRFLINEIVVGEESDVDQNGVRKSHFEIYLDAMEQAGADTQEIKTFIQTLRNTGDLEAAFELANTPEEAREFVRFTFHVILSEKAYLKAAVFTFGREDLIPGMFMSIIRDMHQSQPDAVAIFKYYLERHIEVDGDHHSHLALEMTARLCGDDDAKWNEAHQYTEASLAYRHKLWSGVHRLIEASRASV